MSCVAVAEPTQRPAAERPSPEQPEEHHQEDRAEHATEGDPDDLQRGQAVRDVRTRALARPARLDTSDTRRSVPRRRCGCSRVS